MKGHMQASKNRRKLLLLTVKDCNSFFPVHQGVLDRSEQWKNVIGNLGRDTCKTTASATPTLSSKITASARVVVPLFATTYSYSTWSPILARTGSPMNVEVLAAKPGKDHDKQTKIAQARIDRDHRVVQIAWLTNSSVDHILIFP